MDNEESGRRLKSGEFKGETESTILAAQNQAINTKYFKDKILKEEINRKCQFCTQQKLLTT